MTIDTPYETKDGVVVRWRCAWFDTDGPCYGEFVPTSLRRDETPTQAPSTISEPVVWQEITSDMVHEADLAALPVPNGYKATAPWKLRDIFGLREIYVWRRPLQKVTP